MTYRYVPRRHRMVAQLLTLVVTAILGASIIAAPESTDPRLTIIERAMSADYWGGLLIVFGILGFAAELYSTIRKKQPFFWVVSACHTILCAVLLAFSVSALASVLAYAPYNFGAPALGVLVAFFHYMYVQRRPREPITYVE